MSKYPILFEANEKEFKTHGIGVLSDAVQCDVTEEINGIFELNMVYPSSGKYLKELKNDRLIYADASKELGNQPFRICRVTKLLNGLINVYAQHISYDLGGIQLPPFETIGTSDGMQKVKTYSTTQNDYSFSSTMIVDETDENNAFKTETPKSVRAYLLGEKESFLQAYGGEFTFDRFNVRHSTLRGSDKGFRVKYGANMVDLNQEESIEKTYTGIFPYYKDEYMFMDLTESYDLMYPHKVDTSKLSGKIMYADGTFTHTKIANVDLSPYFEVAPLSTDELNDVAKQYMKDNKIGVPAVSLDVRFESLRKSSEYANVIFLEDVYLGDTIHVDYVKLGVSAIGRINTIIYDSLRHKNKRVSIGNPKNNVADTLISITNSVKGSETNILGMARSVAKIDLMTNQNSASINLFVETNAAGEKQIRGSVLVEAINDQSSVKINADKVELNGYVTVNSLSAEGSTEIDGARIKTGQIISSNYVDDQSLIYQVWLGINQGTYSFKYTDEKYYSFTLMEDIDIRCYIYFDPKKMVISVYDKDNTLLVSVQARNGMAGTVLILDPAAWCSNSGTMINLENGMIKSKYFSLTQSGVSVTGYFVMEEGRIGPAEITPGLLSFRDENDAYDRFMALSNQVIGWSTNRYYALGCTVGFAAGALGTAVEYDDISVKIYNTEEDGYTEKSALVVKPNDAYLSGNWKATPYTDTSADESPIITKQDLINLGLVKA